MTRRKWSDAEIEVLRSRYPHEKTEDIARDMRRPLSGVYARAYSLGLEKSAAFFASAAAGHLRGERGHASRFQKGATPANKGLRRPGYYVGRGRMQSTQFVAGKAPHNEVPVGTERIRDGHYLWRKTRTDLAPARRNWQLVHHLVWIQAHGPIPPTHRVVFKNGDTTDMRIDNLLCVSRAEHVKNVGLHRLPIELVQVIQLRGAITRQLNKRQAPVKPKRGRPRKERIAA